MCLLKVANQRDSGEYIRPPFRAADNSDSGGNDNSYPVADRAAQNPTSMFPGYGSNREMSQMVTALTHVVSGQRQAADWGIGAVAGAGGAISSPSVYSSSPSPPFSDYNSSSGFLNIGQKRGRDNQDDVQPQFFRSAFADSSSSGATGNSFNSLINY